MEHALGKTLSNTQRVGSFPESQFVDGGKRNKSRELVLAYSPRTAEGARLTPGILAFTATYP